MHKRLFPALGLALLLGSRVGQAEVFQFDLALGEAQEHQNLVWKTATIESAVIVALLPPEGPQPPLRVELSVVTECREEFGDLQAYVNFAAPLDGAALAALPPEDLKYGVVDPQAECKGRIDLTRFILHLLDSGAERAELYVGCLSPMAEGNYGLGMTTTATITVWVYR